jgi:hypothetical protein
MFQKYTRYSQKPDGVQYTEKQTKYLISIVPGHSYQEIIDLFRRRFKLQLRLNQIKAFIGNRNLNTGRTGFFEKGHCPFNKGQKGLTIGGVETQFKKGHLPFNYLPVGSERVRTPHTGRYHTYSGDDYIDVKIADPNKWKGKHILIWEAQNGPVPKGYAVIFGDGNNRNFDPKNLILVSRKQLMVLNRKGLIQNDADLTRTAVIVADLYSEISKRKIKAKQAK